MTILVPSIETAIPWASATRTSMVQILSLDNLDLHKGLPHRLIHVIIVHKDNIQMQHPILLARWLILPMTLRQIITINRPSYETKSTTSSRDESTANASFQPSYSHSYRDDRCPDDNNAYLFEVEVFNDEKILMQNNRWTQMMTPYLRVKFLLRHSMMWLFTSLICISLTPEAPTPWLSNKHAVPSFVEPYKGPPQVITTTKGCYQASVYLDAKIIMFPEFCKTRIISDLKLWVFDSPMSRYDIILGGDILKHGFILHHGWTILSWDGLSIPWLQAFLIHT